MKKSTAIEKQYERWYPLIPHAGQQAYNDDILNGYHRFIVNPSGRRSGKTEMPKRAGSRLAMGMGPVGMYGFGAPTENQAKKIFWKDLKELTLSASHPRKPNETDKIIYLPNGSEIHVVGLDAPARIEGQPWRWICIDEFGNVKPDAWPTNIRPALSTLFPDGWRARAVLCGVPEGLNHYFDISEYAKSGIDDNWAHYHWFSSDLLPEEDILEAKRNLSPMHYRQEYEGSFETVSGRIYDDFSNKNASHEVLLPHDVIAWTHDQNKTPMCSAIIAGRDSGSHIVDEIVLESAQAKNVALEFTNRYKGHENKTVWLYGDPYGNIGAKHGHRSYYHIITEILQHHGWQVINRVKRSHPSIEDRQNALRALICNMLGERRFYVNPEKAKWTYKGLSTVQVKEGSAFQEDESNKYHHITTAIGYWAETVSPVDGDGGFSSLSGFY